jgi:hypothetical protein
MSRDGFIGTSPTTRKDKKEFKNDNLLINSAEFNKKLEA